MFGHLISLMYTIDKICFCSFKFITYESMHSVPKFQLLYLFHQFVGIKNEQ